MKEARRAQGAQNSRGSAGLVRRIIRDADIECFAAAHNVVERSHRLLKWCLRVGTVRIKDVHIVEAHPDQALVETGDQIFPRTPLTVGTGPHVVACFGRDNHFVAISSEIGIKNESEGSFSGALRRAVIVCQIKVGDAEVEGTPEDRLTVGYRVSGAKILPKAERY